MAAIWSRNYRGVGGFRYWNGFICLEIATTGSGGIMKNPCEGCRSWRRFFCLLDCADFREATRRQYDEEAKRERAAIRAEMEKRIRERLGSGKTA